MDYLNSVTIKDPCPADWDEMTGGDRSRFCKLCKLNVYNFSAMTREEANALIAEKEGKLCGRYYSRPDGTILTKDCSAVRAARLRRMAAAAIILSVLFSVQGIAALSTISPFGPNYEILHNSYAYQFRPVKYVVDWAEETLAPTRVIYAGAISTRVPNSQSNKL